MISTDSFENRPDYVSMVSQIVRVKANGFTWILVNSVVYFGSMEIGVSRFVERWHFIDYVRTQFSMI